MSIPSLTKDTPVMKAHRSVSDHNDRHISMVYGESALTHVQSMFGKDSPEAEAYAEFLSVGRALNEVYQDNLRAHAGLEHWSAADEKRLQDSRLAVEAHFRLSGAC